MAFNPANLSVTESWNSNVPENLLWVYNAGADDMATTKNASYFNAAGYLLRAGDVIRITASDGKWFGKASGGASPQVGQVVGDVNSF